MLSIFFNSPRPPSSGSNQADLVRTHRPAPAPLESRDRRGAIIPLSRPSRAPRATSSRAESIAEPRREIRGEETPRDAREPDLVAQPAGCYCCARWPFDSTSKWWGEHPRLEGHRTARTLEPRPRVSSRETPRIRVSRTSAYSTAGAHAPTTSQGSRLPPPRVEFTQSSSRRVELDARRARDSRHLRSIRESRSITRLPGCPIRRTARADALTDIDAVDEFPDTRLPFPTLPRENKLLMGSTRAETSRRGAGRSALISRVGILLAVLVLSGAPIASATTFNKCLENERVENGLCAPCTGGGTRAAGDDPAAGDTGCTFPDGTALKAAVDSCLAVDPTGVACCSHGADCGAAGTTRCRTGTCRW